MSCWKSSKFHYLLENNLPFLKALQKKNNRIYYLTYIPFSLSIIFCIGSLYNDSCILLWLIVEILMTCVGGPALTVLECLLFIKTHRYASDLS